MVVLLSRNETLQWSPRWWCYQIHIAYNRRFFCATMPTSCVGLDDQEARPNDEQQKIAIPWGAKEVWDVTRVPSWNLVCQILNQRIVVHISIQGLLTKRMHTKRVGWDAQGGGRVLWEGWVQTLSSYYRRLPPRSNNQAKRLHWSRKNRRWVLLQGWSAPTSFSVEEEKEHWKVQLGFSRISNLGCWDGNSSYVHWGSICTRKHSAKHLLRLQDWNQKKIEDDHQRKDAKDLQLLFQAYYYFSKLERCGGPQTLGETHPDLPWARRIRC